MKPIAAKSQTPRDSRYYAEKLSAQKLREVYDLAPARIQRYLKAEIDFVLGKIPPDARVLDLGCGYGRAMPSLMGKAAFVVGIDNSLQSLLYASELLVGKTGFALGAMDAARLGFTPESFDAVVCIQNGISAFKVPPRSLIEESLRVTRRGGIILFSTYADAFWEHRLEWFRLQVAHELVGEIDEERTRRGEIVCRDGFCATTFTPEDFRRLTLGLPAEITIEEVDGSSLFCLVRPH